MESTISRHEQGSPEWHFEQILISMGADTNREGLQDTPKRYIKFLREFLKPKQTNFTTFENEGTNNLILVKDIEFYSLCEHHTLPFFGTGDIAYIPRERIIGLSKIPRLLIEEAEQFQNQERITVNVAKSLFNILDPHFVAVRLKAKHLCMCMRGIKSQNSFTETTHFLGSLNSEYCYESYFEKAKQEFLSRL